MGFEEAGRRRNDPWMTSFVDLNPDIVAGRLAGARPVHGRRIGCV
jgi:hypothetical protein